MEYTESQIDEMIGHLRTVKRNQGTEKAEVAANAIGFFLDSLKTEMETELIPDDEDDAPFFLNLTK